MRNLDFLSNKEQAQKDCLGVTKTEIDVASLNILRTIYREHLDYEGTESVFKFVYREFSKRYPKKSQSFKYWLTRNFIYNNFIK